MRSLSPEEIEEVEEIMRERHPLYYNYSNNSFKLSSNHYLIIPSKNI